MKIEQITEKWSQKYKKSIDCSNPKGFSQKAHCAGRKKTEAFDNPYKLDYDDEIEGYDQTMSVQLPDKTYLTITFNNEGNNQWVVEFYRANTQELTGQGDAQRIFATVIDAIQKFIKKQKPASIYFSADKMVEPGQNAESRAKLYNSLVKRYASALGYDSKINDQGDQVNYTLKKKESVNEGYKLYLERGRTKDVLHITDTSTGHRTEVRGKSNYETKYDPNDRLHKLLDRIGKAANISELLNGEPVGINPNHPDGSDAKNATTKAFNEHGLVPMYSTMKAYGMRKKTTNGQKHFVTDDVDEDTPLSFLKRKASHMVYSGQYERAAKKLHDILTRKYKETGGKLRHALGYYAHMLSRQTGEKLNWRELQQEYLDTYGNMYFEDVTERSLTKGEEKKKEKIVKGMKKNKDDFKKRYGDEAEAVMYATATKMAKKK